MTSQPPAFDHSQLRVLLVEDNPGDALLVRRHLERDGYRHIDVATNLRDALDLLRGGNRPDVILCDLYLPDGEGAANVAAMRAISASIPIVVLTSDGRHQRGVESLAAGADEFYTKDELGRISLQRALRFAIERHRLQEQMHSLMWDNAEPMMVLSPEGSVLFANRAAGDLLGNGEAESLAGIQLDLPLFSGWTEICFLCVEGEAVEVEMRTSPASWHGRFAILVVVRDISEFKALRRSQRQAQRAVAESDSRLKLVLSQLPIGLWTTDAELRVRSHHGDAALGPAIGEGEDSAALEQASPHASVLEAHREALVRGSARFEYERGGRFVEGIVSRREGASAEQDTLLVGFAMEVTERRQLEQQLLQAQKMDAVGRLAGGIAHDFNNLLTGILSFAHFALESFDRDHRAFRDVSEIIRSADQAAALTRQLLSFSRRQPLKPQVVDLGDSIQNAQRLLRRLLSAEVAFESHVEEGLWPVKLDPNAFEQVLMNLCVNARDAMPSGGTLRVTARNVECGTGPVDAEGVELSPGAYVEVAVTDTGCGMPAQLVDRAFEPFFTTKGEGEGTGLGLSIVYSMVKQSGGSIRIESEVGRGTTVRMFWPRTRELKRSGFIVPAESVVDGHETILLVEDEPAVRELAKRALEEVGYRVLSASDGSEALWRAREHEGRIDLVLADLVMPKLSGRTLATRLAASRPDARLLFLSGYGDAQAEVRDLVGERAVLGKPFSPPRICAAVREALDHGLILSELPRRKRVLVVDDDSGILRAADRLLRDRWEVVLADRAATAAERIDQESFDVIVCDIVMPDMDGSELHSWARIEHPDAASRFVFLTGALGDDFVDSFLQKAGRPVIPKPMDPQVMRELVVQTAEQ